jgi:predicted nucleic acid-binding protein
MPDRVIITDTSCLIALSRMDMLFVLKELYREILITPEIAKEYGDSLPDWVLISQVKDVRFQRLLSDYLDKGEASAIALALELKNCTLILDDLKVRKEAEKLRLPYTGTLGVLFKAKQRGIIARLKPCLEQLQGAGFRIAKPIMDELLKRSGEL